VRDKPKNRKENEADFYKLLQEAIDLGASPIRSNIWLHGNTIRAIDAVAQAYPNVDPKLIQNARKEYAKELDGTQVLGVEQEIDRIVRNAYPT
jgi:hypothetical protein